MSVVGGSVVGGAEVVVGGGFVVVGGGAVVVGGGASVVLTTGGGRGRGRGRGGGASVVIAAASVVGAATVVVTSTMGAVSRLVVDTAARGHRNTPARTATAATAPPIPTSATGLLRRSCGGA